LTIQIVVGILIGAASSLIATRRYLRHHQGWFSLNNDNKQSRKSENNINLGVRAISTGN
jgi:hypothetical protein